MKSVPLKELAVVIRSKNAGPYELTLDMIFRDAASYARVKASGFFTPELFARLYSTTPNRVLKLVFFDPANAVKVTLARPRVCGDPGETDVYGAQQHAPLLELSIPMPE